MLLEHRRQLVVAIDEDGGVAGILTLEGILDPFGEVTRQRREELLGARQG